jgi:hypothetical protein
MAISTKYILIILVLLQTNLSFCEETDQVACAQSLEDFLIMELVDDIENLSRFNAKDAAKKLVLTQCRTEKDQGNDTITIKNGKIRFSEFSDQYDVQDPVYFCKNNAGHRSHVSQVSQKIIQFSREKERKKRELAYRNNPPKKKQEARKRVAPKSKKEEMWVCSPPNYLDIRRLVNKQVMETLVLTHGAGVCKRAN